MSINVERTFWNFQNTNGWQVVNKKSLSINKLFFYILTYPTQ